jgi:hypothetical protein
MSFVQLVHTLQTARKNGRRVWDAMSLWSWTLLAAIVLGFVLCLASPKPSGEPPILSPPDPAVRWQRGLVVSVDKQSKKLSISPTKKAENYESETYSVADRVNPVLASLGVGDIVWYSVDQHDRIAHLALRQDSLGLGKSVGSILLAFSLVWGAILWIAGGHPWSFALGLDHRLSNSQTQIYLWFITLTTIYLAQLGLRTVYTPYFGGIGVDAKLLALAGISAATFGAARANTTIKAALAPGGIGAALAPGGAKGPPGRRLSRWEYLWDLFTNDQGTLDLGDFQMIALNAVAILVYLVLSIEFLSSLAFASHVDLPPVDDTLLGGTATAQGAYLLKKFGSHLGN